MAKLRAMYLHLATHELASQELNNKVSMVIFAYGSGFELVMKPETWRENKAQLMQVFPKAEKSTLGDIVRVHLDSHDYSEEYIGEVLEIFE